ncbi:hypothetical protein Aple_059680 [Acrocarpospora pleiomorpha]|uniref:Uncharacterized protein n=1 Tax=Acrocarpospora pleiomorpha TaxID=90975 RepID=A0A5M3XSV7_9ACTN|nr:hypothetical protein Aple_059680 [Acrocarpospora pleiomorpha]
MGSSSEITIETNGYRVKLDSERASAKFDMIGILSQTQVTSRELCSAIRPVRIIVELFLFTGGRLPYALVGGLFTPGEGENLDIRVHLSADVVCDLENPIKRAGLAREFAEPLMVGLLEELPVDDLPAGELVVDRGVYDELESSAMSFRMAGRLLRSTTAALLHNRDIESAVRYAIAR